MCPVSWVMLDDLKVEERGIFEPEAIRGRSNSVPVVVLGGQTGEGDRMLLLQLEGTSQEQTVSPKELLAQVRTAMEQLSLSANREIVAFGDVRIDLTSMEARRAGRSVPMTRQEFKIIRYFAKFANRVVSREVLLNEVWGYNNYPCTRTVDNHMLRLRQKLEPDPSSPRYFLTIHGTGYKFVPSGSVA